MTVIFAGKSYDCTKAVKGVNKATLYLAEGGPVKFSGINDWSAFELEGGAWETAAPAPTVEELQAKITALTTSNQMLEDCLVEMAGVIYA